MQKGGSIFSVLDKYSPKGPIGIKKVDPTVLRGPLRRRRGRRGKGLISDMIKNINKQ